MGTTLSRTWQRVPHPNYQEEAPLALAECLESRRLLAAAGLVAAYAFDAGVGTTAADASGTGNTGTISGAAWSSAGKFGGALSFNGTSNWVSVADAASLHLAKGMTLEAWVNPTSLTGWKTALLKERPGGLAYALYTSDNSSRPPAAYVNTGGADVSAVGTANLALNAWTHLASTYDGTNLRLYVNGALVRTQTAAGTLVASTGALRIGGNAVWGEYFAGRLDEVRVYNRALAQSEVQADMNTALAPPAPDTTPPGVSVASPAGGATVSGSTTLSATATDNVGVAGVQFLLDGAALGAEDTAAPYALAWDTSKVANGAHAITARARDAAGNATTSAPVNVTVNNVQDLAAPSVSVTGPADGASLNGTVPVSADAADDVGVVGVQFRLDGVNLGAEDTTAPYTVNWDTRAAANGPHALAAVARDAAGHVTTSASVGVAVANPDTTAPTVALSAPAAGATVSGSAVAVSATASDNVGVAGVQFLLDGNPLGAEDAGAPYTIAWDSTAVANGSHTLGARARDAAGNVTAASARTVTVSNPIVTFTVNAAQRFQKIDGLGVNLNSQTWNNGAVVPQLDALVNVMGASAYRLIVESVSGWEDANDNADPNTFNWAYYNQLYATPKFTDLFNEMKYLSDHRLPVYVNVMGTIPGWMGGTGLPNAAAEDEFVEMEASMLYYAVNTLGLHVDTFSPMNEQDLGSPEGPAVGVTQYVTVVNKLISRLKGLGLGSIQIAPAETASNGTSYVDALYASASAMPSIYHLTFHNYAGSDGNFDADVKNSGWAGRNFWVTEYGPGFFAGDQGTPVPDEWAYSQTGFEYLVSHLQGGAAGAFAYDGIDSYYQHHGSYSTLGQIGFDPVTNTYTLRKRMYAHAQVDSFVRPGMYRVGSTVSGAGLSSTMSFYDPVNGRVVIVGENKGTTPVTISGVIQGANVTSMSLYETTRTLNVQRMADVPVTNGTFRVTVDPGSIFTIASPLAPDTQPPAAPTGLTATNGYGAVALAWGASSDNVAVTEYDVYRSTAPDVIPSAATYVGKTSTTSYTDAVAGGTYYYVVLAADAAGNVSPASIEASGSSLVDSVPPAVAVTSPANGGGVSGTVALSADASDDVGVAGVQFFVDGVALGAEDTAAPYTVPWNTAAAANGVHTITARARDVAGNPTTSAAVTVTVSNAAVATGLVGAWGFDETGGATASDATGHALSGAVSSAAWTTAGRYGGALSFNGANAWVTVADNNLLDLTTGMTLEAWVRPNALSGWTTVMMKERGTAGFAYALYASDDTGQPPAGYVYRASDVSARGASALAVGAWAHLATTYDGANLRLYVNGTLLGTRAVTGALTNTTNPFRIGGNSVWGEYFNGLIDEVRVYSRPLSQAEIQSDMSTPVNPPSPPTAAAAAPALASAAASPTATTAAAAPAPSTPPVFNTRTIRELKPAPVRRPPGSTMPPLPRWPAVVPPFNSASLVRPPGSVDELLQSTRRAADLLRA